MIVKPYPANALYCARTKRGCAALDTPQQPLTINVLEAQMKANAHIAYSQTDVTPDIGVAITYVEQHQAWDCAYVLREDFPFSLLTDDRLFVEVAFQQGPEAITPTKARRLHALAEQHIGVRV